MNDSVAAALFMLAPVVILMATGAVCLALTSAPVRHAARRFFRWLFRLTTEAGAAHYDTVGYYPEDQP